MITLDFLELDDKTMVSWYSIKFDPGTLLQSMLNDIQKLEQDEKCHSVLIEQNGECHSVGTVQIYKDKELYDEPIVEVKYIGGIISDTEWEKIPIHILNKPVKYAYMFATTTKDGNYHITITVK